VYTSDKRIKHPVSVFKSDLAELENHETIDTVFEMFLENIADAGELEELQGKIRRVFGQVVDMDLATTGRVRRALADVIS
jgi:hypothetical protein